mmetsp:Transcript_61853/g.119181  ORF Transcript_61853/g.119181 Transcript_61853/m.119181 type:complete len:153 (-) Transcript_61853:50-508(-)
MARMTWLQQVAHALTIAGSACLSAGLIVLSFMAFADPQGAAVHYAGVAASASAVPYVIAMGVRDLALGLATMVLAFKVPAAMRFFAPTVLVVPIGDVVTTLTHGTTLLQAAPHILGTAGVAVFVIATWLDPALDFPNGLTEPFAKDANRDST